MANSPWKRAFGLGKIDRTTLDLIEQGRRGEWLDRVREHRKHLRLAWSCAGGAMCLAAFAIGGCIYLGTLPKSVVEWGMLDPHGFPFRAYAKEIASDDDTKQAHQLLIVAFLRGLREVYPFDKQHQNAVVNVAAKMTKENSPAWKKASAYFTETKPYERQKRESVFIDVAYIFPESQNTWRITFCEVIRSLVAVGSERAVEYNATLFTEVDTSKQGRKASPLGLYVQDFHISDGKAVQSCGQ